MQSSPVVQLAIWLPRSKHTCPFVDLVSLYSLVAENGSSSNEVVVIVVSFIDIPVSSNSSSKSIIDDVELVSGFVSEVDNVDAFCELEMVEEITVEEGV